MTLQAVPSRAGEQKIISRRHCLHLERQGTPVGSMDMLIAAQVIAHSLTLITHDLKRVSENTRPEMRDLGRQFKHEMS